MQGAVSSIDLCRVRAGQTIVRRGAASSTWIEWPEGQVKTPSILCAPVPGSYSIDFEALLLARLCSGMALRLTCICSKTEKIRTMLWQWMSRQSRVFVWFLTPELDGRLVRPATRRIVTMAVRTNPARPPSLSYGLTRFGRVYMLALGGTDNQQPLVKAVGRCRIVFNPRRAAFGVVGL